MRANGVAGLAAVLAALTLPGIAPALAGASAVQGHAVSGGAAFDAGAPRPAGRPVVSQLMVSPNTVTAGGPLPQLRLRVRQSGVTQVQARVVVVRLPRNAPVARISLGWVTTGALVTASWPAGISLRDGRYAVQVHAKDPRGHNLRRTPQLPGRTRIIVRGHATGPAMIAQPSAALPAPAPSPGGRGVFPVAGPFTFGGADGRFGAGRPGHIHQGQDIVAAEGTPVVAPYAGKISSTSYQAGGAGEYIVLDAVDGRDYFFAHCVRGSTAVTAGAAVAAGAHLCLVGATGSATGPHLHFEIWEVGWRVPGGYPIDPLPELRAWAPAGST